MSDIPIVNASLTTRPEISQKPRAHDLGKESFGDCLNTMIAEVNTQQNEADRAIANVELGNTGSIHDAMIALEKANISFRTMLQVRNKVIEAYQEIMRMQV